MQTSLSNQVFRCKNQETGRSNDNRHVLSPLLVGVFKNTPKSVLFLISCSPWKTRLATYKTISASILQEEKSIEQSNRFLTEVMVTVKLPWPSFMLIPVYLPLWDMLFSNITSQKYIFFWFHSTVPHKQYPGNCNQSCTMSFNLKREWKRS